MEITTLGIIGLILFVLFIIFILIFLIVRSTLYLDKRLERLEEKIDASSRDVLSLKEKINVALYQEAILKIKKGETVANIATDLKISMAELKALERAVKASDN